MENFTKSNIHRPQLADLLVEVSSGYSYVIYTWLKKRCR